MFSLHPVIRILNYFIVAIFLACGDLTTLMICTIWVLIDFVWHANQYIGPLLRLINRLRWLWASILIIYFWFTPGELLLPQLGSWSPSLQGVQSGWSQIGILFVMVTASSGLVNGISRPRFIAALRFLFSPLAWLGISTDRFAVRMILVLEYVPQLDPARLFKQVPKSSGEGRLKNLGRAVQGMLEYTEHQARKSPLNPIDVVHLSSMSVLDWLFLTSLTVALTVTLL